MEKKRVSNKKKITRNTYQVVSKAYQKSIDKNFKLFKKTFEKLGESSQLNNA